MRIGFTLHKVRSSVVSDESWVPGGLGQAYTIFFNKQPITLFSVDGWDRTKRTEMWNEFKKLYWIETAHRASM